jgi:hypothetical protein
VAVGRNGHDHVGSAGAVDELVKSVDRAQDRDRVSLRMERKMPALGPQAGRPGVTCVDESDDRQAGPGFLAEPSNQPAGIAAGAHEHNAAAWQHPGGAPGNRPGSVLWVIHVKPPTSWSRSDARAYP